MLRPHDRVTRSRMEVEALVNVDTEDDLVARAKRGDPSAGPFLVSLYGERLLGYARAHAPDLTDVDRESIVEMAIEAGVRAIGAFDPLRGTLFSWFRTQVRYKTLAFRRSHVRSEELTGQETEFVIDGDLDLPGPVVEALRSAISRLSSDDQLILALRDAEGLEYLELSERIGLTQAAARQRHSRAIRRLREQAQLELALQKYVEERNYGAGPG